MAAQAVYKIIKGIRHKLQKDGTYKPSRSSKAPVSKKKSVAKKKNTAVATRKSRAVKAKSTEGVPVGETRVMSPARPSSMRRSKSNVVKSSKPSASQKKIEAPKKAASPRMSRADKARKAVADNKTAIAAGIITAGGAVAVSNADRRSKQREKKEPLRKLGTRAAAAKKKATPTSTPTPAPKTKSQKVTGKGGKTVDTAKGKRANVTKEQLSASGLGLTAYMNQWNKTGKRPSKAPSRGYTSDTGGTFRSGERAKIEAERKKIKAAEKKKEKK